MQKVHQNSLYKGEIGIFLIIAFGVSAIFSFCLTVFYLNANGETITVFSNKKMRRFFIYSVTCGIGLCNQINMYLAGAMESINFYPMAKGASIILAAAAGIFIWKEQLSKKQWYGLVIGGIAILLLCNIF